MAKKVLIGISGGVDSSVSALLLKEQGYEVIGATMYLYDEQDYTDAEKVCQQLNIKHYIFDCRNEFKCNVVNQFIESYENAQTPNPCVECNKKLKFELFWEKAKELGCEYIATGHYAKLEFNKKYNQVVLEMDKNNPKDQTYFLYGIQKEMLSHILFPLADYNKDEIRKIAREKGLFVAEKPESQEICFIPNNNYGEFINKYIINESGNFVLKDGTIIGKHNGIVHYTVGQRKGLGITYKTPLYVIKINKAKNEVVLGEEADLYKTELYANHLNFLLNISLEKPIKIYAKIRYRTEICEGIFSMQENDLCKIEFKKPQRAITPGQSVVFYIDNILLGGGKII